MGIFTALGFGDPWAVPFWGPLFKGLQGGTHFRDCVQLLQGKRDSFRSHMPLISIRRAARAYAVLHVAPPIKSADRPAKGRLNGSEGVLLTDGQ